MKRPLAGYCVLLNINEMETLNHRIRAGIWRSTLRFGSSAVGVLPRIVIDVDSTVKTVYSNQQGVSVGYNPHKCGACFASSALSVLRGYKGNSSRLASKRRCLYGQWSGWIYATTSSPSSESYPYIVSWRQWLFCGEITGLSWWSRPGLPDQGQIQRPEVIARNKAMDENKS